MQIALNSPKRIAVAIAGIFGIFFVIWILLGFDEAYVGARQFISNDEYVVSKAGKIKTIGLYKLRYFDKASNDAKCFARYYFFVSGTISTVNVQVDACGNRDAPIFFLKER